MRMLVNPDVKIILTDSLGAGGVHVSQKLMELASGRATALLAKREGMPASPLVLLCLFSHA